MGHPGLVGFDGGGVDGALTSVRVPLLVVDLDDLRVTRANEAAMVELGLPTSAVVGQTMAALAAESDGSAATAALLAMRAGTIDFYRAHVDVTSRNGSSGVRTEWVRTAQFGERRVALVEVSRGDVRTSSPLTEYLGHEPRVMAIGTVDHDWTVTAISNEIEQLVGVRPGDIVGTPLLDRRSAGRVQDVLERDGSTASVATRVVMADARRRPQHLCGVISTVAGPALRCFVLVDDPAAPAEPVDRVAVLERHLRKIAAELEAAGILEHLGPVTTVSLGPEADSLTRRQWEVLIRLLRGDRVPAIAADLFVSQSTVRNHLSAIFDLYGVHSQSELLRRVRRTDGPPG